MTGITESFILAGNKGMSVRVTVQEDYDIVANTSDITVAAEVVSSAYFGHIYYLSGSVTAAGQTLQTLSAYLGTHNVYVQQTDTYYPVRSGSEEYSGSPWSLDGIVHDTDGSKTVTVSISLTGEEASGKGADGWTVTGSREITLTHIPRASTVAATDAAVGAVSMVAVSRKSTAYTHSVAYRFGTLSGYIAPGGLSAAEVRFSDTSVAFTLPESFYSQIPNAKTGTCTLTCRTYSGDTQVGDAQSCTFTVKTDGTVCAPLVSGTVADVNESTLALTGDTNILVRYMSDALCTITAQAKNSASITGKAIGGAAVTGDSRTITEPETGSVVFSATDGRGYSTSVTVEKQLIPYIRLTCNLSGKRTDPTSGNAQLTVAGDYFDGSFGAADNALTLQYRVGDGTWIPLAPSVSGNEYTASALLTGLTYTSAFTIEVQAADKLQTVTKSIVIGKGIPVFDWGENDFSFHVPVYLHGGGICNADGSQPFAPAAKMVTGHLGSNGWYRVGVLSVGHMEGFTAAARMSIGGWYNDQNAHPAIIDIAFQYQGGYLQKVFDNLVGTHFTQVRLCRIDNYSVGVDLYYGGSGTNYTYVTVHEIQGSFAVNSSYVNVTDSTETVLTTLDMNRVQNTRTDLLWENASPGTSFPAQTISLDLSGYDCVEVVASVGELPTSFTGSAKVPIGQSGSVCGFIHDFWLHARTFTVNGGGVIFQSGYMKDTSTGTVYADWDMRSVPYKIYGIKEGQ